MTFFFSSAGSAQRLLLHLGHSGHSQAPAIHLQHGGQCHLLLPARIQKVSSHQPQVPGKFLVKSENQPHQQRQGWRIIIAQCPPPTGRQKLQRLPCPTGSKLPRVPRACCKLCTCVQTESCLPQCMLLQVCWMFGQDIILLCLNLTEVSQYGEKNCELLQMGS